MKKFLFLIASTIMTFMCIQLFHNNAEAQYPIYSTTTIYSDCSGGVQVAPQAACSAPPGNGSFSYSAACSAPPAPGNGGGSFSAPQYAPSAPPAVGYYAPGFQYQQRIVYRQSKPVYYAPGFHIEFSPRYVQRRYMTPQYTRRQYIQPYSYGRYVSNVP